MIIIVSFVTSNNRVHTTLFMFWSRCSDVDLDVINTFTIAFQSLTSPTSEDGCGVQGKTRLTLKIGLCFQASVMSLLHHGTNYLTK